MNYEKEREEKLEQFLNIQKKGVLNYLAKQLEFKIKSKMEFYKTALGKPLNASMGDDNLDKPAYGFTVEQVAGIKFAADLSTSNLVKEDSNFSMTLLRYYADNEDILNFKTQYENKLRREAAPDKVLIFPLAELVIEDIQKEGSTKNICEFIQQGNIMPYMIDETFTLNIIQEQQKQKTPLVLEEQLEKSEEKIKKVEALKKDDESNLPKVPLNNKQVENMLSDLDSSLLEIPENESLFSVALSSDKSKTSKDDKDNPPNEINLVLEPRYLTIESIDSKFQSIFKPENIKDYFFELKMKELAKELQQYTHDHNFAQFFIDENINGNLNAIGQQQMQKVDEIIIRNPDDFLPKLTNEEEIEFLNFLETHQVFKSNGNDNDEEKKKIMFYTSLRSEIERHKIKLPENAQVSFSSSTNVNPRQHSKNSSETQSHSRTVTYIPDREKFNLPNIQNCLKELYKKRAHETFDNNLYLETYKVLLIDRWKEKLPLDTIRCAAVKVTRELEEKITYNNKNCKTPVDFLKVDLKKISSSEKELFFKVNKIAETLKTRHIFLGILNDFNIISDPSWIEQQKDELIKETIKNSFLRDKQCIEAIFNYSWSSSKSFKKDYKTDFEKMLTDYVSNKENQLDKSEVKSLVEKANDYFKKLTKSLTVNYNNEKIKVKFSMEKWQNSEIRNMFFEIKDEEIDIEKYFAEQIKKNQELTLNQHFGQDYCNNTNNIVVLDKDVDTQKKQ